MSTYKNIFIFLSVYSYSIHASLTPHDIHLSLSSDTHTTETHESSSSAVAPAELWRDKSSSPSDQIPHRDEYTTMTALSSEGYAVMQQPHQGTGSIIRDMNSQKDLFGMTAPIVPETVVFGNASKKFAFKTDHNNHAHGRTILSKWYIIDLAATPPTQKKLPLPKHFSRDAQRAVFSLQDQYLAICSPHFGSTIMDTKSGECKFAIPDCSQIAFSPHTHQRFGLQCFGILLNKPYGTKDPRLGCIKSIFPESPQNNTDINVIKDTSDGETWVESIAATPQKPHYLIVGLCQNREDGFENNLGQYRIIIMSPEGKMALKTLDLCAGPLSTYATAPEISHAVTHLQPIGNSLILTAQSQRVFHMNTAEHTSFRAISFEAL